MNMHASSTRNVSTHKKGLLWAVTTIYILTASGLDIFNPALPEIQRVFGASVQDISLLLNLYFLAFSLLAVAMGVVGDRYDKRKVVLSCLTIFLVGSTLTLLPNIHALMAGRLMQGVGASGPVVLSLVVLLENSSPDEHPALVGLVSAVVAIATCLAPIIGAVITKTTGWRGSFALLFAIALCATIMVHKYMPGSPGNSSVRLSAASYLRLLRSDWLPAAVIVSLLRANYIAFLGFSALYYVNYLDVSLVAMGFHLGTLAFAFSVSSVFSPRISGKFGDARCVRFCLWATVIVSALLVFQVALFEPNPIIITANMAVVSALVVLPNNIIYPKILSLVTDMRGRSAAVVHALKMIFSAAIVQALAIIYDQGIVHVTLVLCIAYLLSGALYETLVRDGVIGRLIAPSEFRMDPPRLLLNKRDGGNG